MIGDLRNCEICKAEFEAKDDCHWICDYCASNALEDINDLADAAVLFDEVRKGGSDA